LGESVSSTSFGLIVSQGIFWVASVSLVEHRYALRSKGKLILEDSDRLRGKQKLIPGNTKRLPGNTDWLSGKNRTRVGLNRVGTWENRAELG
jgi:hypothetical protein